MYFYILKISILGNNAQYATTSNTRFATTLSVKPAFVR